MKDRLKKVGIGASLLAAFALGGSAVASALSDESAAPTGAAAPSRAADTAAGGSTEQGAIEEGSTDRGKPQRSDEELLTGETATRVETAALAEIEGGTIERVETDADGNAAYEAHMITAGGARVTVYVDEEFNVVSVDESPGRGGHSQSSQGNDGQESSESTSA